VPELPLTPLVPLEPLSPLSPVLANVTITYSPLLNGELSELATTPPSTVK
jgi:hypothetical protein